MKAANRPPIAPAANTVDDMFAEIGLGIKPQDVRVTRKAKVKRSQFDIIEMEKAASASRGASSRLALQDDDEDEDGDGTDGCAIGPSAGDWGDGAGDDLGLDDVEVDDACVDGER